MALTCRPTAGPPLEHVEVLPGEANDGRGRAMDRGWAWWEGREEGLPIVGVGEGMFTERAWCNFFNYL